jgi:hypothetical protein
VPGPDCARLSSIGNGILRQGSVSPLQAVPHPPPSRAAPPFVLSHDSVCAGPTIQSARGPRSPQSLWLVRHSNARESSPNFDSTSFTKLASCRFPTDSIFKPSPSLIDACFETASAKSPPSSNKTTADHRVFSSRFACTASALFGEYRCPMRQRYCVRPSPLPTVVSHRRNLGRSTVYFPSSSFCLTVAKARLVSPACFRAPPRNPHSHWPLRSSAFADCYSPSSLDFP